MASIRHCFHDLDTVVDQIREILDDWNAQTRIGDSIGIETLELLKVAVHEWIANLAQHANFNGHPPQVTFTATPRGRRLECIIEDNSAGFDLEAQLANCAEILEAYPERGMGLLMLQACTEELQYASVGEHRQRLHFYIPADQDPWLKIPF
ncbi:ATP-binding protein [Rhodothermaceae bacterium RA]|nr:ATP-binding protein [Rhodothermaceae bacterium RA]